VGPYQFSPSRPEEYYDATFEDNTVSPIYDFSALTVLTCARAYHITTNAKLWGLLDKEREVFQPFTFWSILWYLPLAIGFALKYAKNMSDLKKARHA
jgi:hypothetical protein